MQRRNGTHSHPHGQGGTSTMMTKPDIAAAHIRDQILSGVYRVDERLPAERDLSASLECSQFTIGRALALLAEEGLIEKKRGSGNYVKSTRETTSVAFLTSVSRNVVNPIWNSIFDALNILNDSPHIHFSLLVTPENSSPIPTHRLSEADIVISARDGGDAYTDNVLALGKPVIWLSDNARELPGASVAFDNYQAGVLAADHLYDAGCRNLIYVQYDTACWENQRRFDGFRETLQGREAFVNLLTYTWFGDDAEALRRLEHLLQRGNGIDGAFCFADVLSARVVKAAQTVGRRVPDDLQVMGVDNSELSQLFIPPLTSIRQDSAAFAREILASIHAHRMRQPIADVHLIEPLLIPRESSRGLAAGEDAKSREHAR